MPWVTFSTDFDFRAKPNVLTAYKKGNTYLVSQACADQAMAARAATVADRPRSRKETENARREAETPSRLR